MITKADIPDYAPATVQLEAGWTAEIRVENDPDGALSACAVEHGADGPCASQVGPWIGVVVIMRDDGGQDVDSNSLWGIEEDCGDYWREVAAELINELATGAAMPANGTEG
jgi:hypothetical protein